MQIEEFKFGSFRIDGMTYLSDIKIIDKRIKYWAGRTRYDIELSQLKDLLVPMPELVIIGTGAAGLMKVPIDVKMFFMNNRIPIIIEKTDAACKEFNKAMKAGKKVHALLVSTC